MPRGLKLTEFEKGQIYAFSQQNMPKREIARRLRRSDYVVRNFLRNPQNYGTRKRSGRPVLLKPRDQRRIGRAMSNSLISLSKIKQQQTLSASITTIWRAVQSNKNIVRAKMKAAPNLKAHHMKNRDNFARANMAINWKQVCCL